MKKYSLIFIVLFIFNGCSKESINWYNGNLDDAVKVNNDKLIMIDFYTDWWYACGLLDAKTFTDETVVNYLNQNYINLKIDAETNYGNQLFGEYNGSGFPLILFLDSNKNEVDRFYGYLDSKAFLEKITEVKNGKNTFPILQAQYEKGDNSAETMSKLAGKYSERGDDSTAAILYKSVIQSKNLSSKMFFEAKYFLSCLELSKNNYDSLQNYINKYPDSPFTKEAVNKLLKYFKSQNSIDMEIAYFDKYIDIYYDDPWFLNQFAWRMTELEKNLDKALEKINYAINIADENTDGIANIIDTKAEVLWKLGKNEMAIEAIEEAILLEPENSYYQKQKNKFIN